ncbi:IclR family transcriptional regulator [Gellertiella hungarica]|uniref:DNA-binding IclR family transcriptional regulator n=1 Tax=Gellertiella hungarica TaxID=1572859 RepID=A0A7W6J8N1_9HYPH|nr:IclR family transcriptional regulator [Gellertiella hungarica]MBB4065976.1 DNA-binding IclR family transcriptional regulator [Gellertiella hungarica]
MSSRETKPHQSPALERGARILDIVARSRTFLSLSDLSRELKIARSSVHSLCQTLVNLELLIRRSDHTFQLGPHVMRWSNAFTLQSDVATEFAAIWDQETGLPGATITLTVQDGVEVVYIAARNSERSRTGMEFRVGMRLPAAFTATGKAFLSHMSDYEIRRLYAQGLPEARTPHSVRTVDNLLAELRDIRRDGYSCDEEQIAEGMVCFGATVLDSRNRPIAGVAVSLSMDAEAVAERGTIIENVLQMAARLSHRMGADLSAAAGGGGGGVGSPLQK